MVSRLIKIIYFNFISLLFGWVLNFFWRVLKFVCEGENGSLIIFIVVILVSVFFRDYMIRLGNCISDIEWFVVVRKILYLSLFFFLVNK